MKLTIINTMKIGFIGAGKVGSTLAKYFISQGISVAGFYSQSFANAEQVCQFTGCKPYTSIAALLDDSDVILITVPDSQIANVWSELCLLPLNNKLVGHCSGLLSSDIFMFNQSVYPFGFSLHPLYAIYDRFTCYQSMHHAYFTLQSDSETVLNQLQHIFTALPNHISVIDGAQKSLYHAACVLLSNHVIALAQIGSDMLKQCGLDEQFSEQAWHPLFLGNAQSLCQYGTLAALTGPIERADVETIKQHLTALSPDIKPLYQQLSLVLLKISQQKHPQRDYQPLQLELLP
ncbi:Rossmann-like and DUF2520 domain-containing protein [Orbus sasakiae]|uniref:Rossmann-like and DUF2520 domain-containing protein n=1 Tax=Orbus sasakiae TaxID=1078475 RepID=A0ABP9N3Y8_9GAMM